MLFTAIEKGQGLVEYAIILAFVAVLVIIVLTGMGPKIVDAHNSIVNSGP